MNLGLLAQISGLRDDPIPPFSGASGGISPLAFVQMIAALGIVLWLIKWIVPKYFAKTASKRTQQTANSEVKVLETITTSGGTLLLIAASGRKLLLGAGANGFTTLAEFEELYPETQSMQSGEFRDALNRLQKLQS